MQVLILCGGRGIIDPERRRRIPKGMVQVGNRPLLWHIMSLFAMYGCKDFVLAVGEGEQEIRSYFVNHAAFGHDIEISSSGTRLLNRIEEEDWVIRIINTGLKANTGGRIARCKRYLDHDDFFLTYSDCLANVNLNHLVEFHRARKKILTVTGVQPPSRFGTFYVKDDEVTGYSLDSRVVGKGGYINGGFMLMQPEIFSWLEPFDECNLEQEVFSNLAAEGKVGIFPHEGYWHGVDSERDILEIGQLYENNIRPWLPGVADLD